MDPSLTWEDRTDTKIVEQLLDALLPTLEALERQSAAVLLFLKDKGIATGDQLAPTSSKPATQATSAGALPACAQ
jgi:hypothetical protein